MLLVKVEIIFKYSSHLCKKCMKYSQVRQVLLALKHLHSFQVAHLDIKPENILLSSSPPMPSIKLIGNCQK